MLQELLSSLRYIHHYKFNSVFFKYFRAIFAVTLSAFLGLVLLLSFYYTSSYRDELVQQNEMSVTRAKKSFDTLLSTMVGASNYLSADGSISGFLLSPPDAKTPAEQARFLIDVQRLLGAFTLTDNSIHSIYIYSHYNHQVLSSSTLLDLERFQDHEVIQDYLDSGGTTSALFPRRIPPAGSDMEPVNAITYIHPISSIGVIVINFDTAQLPEILQTKNAADDSSFLFITDQNQVIYATDKSWFMQPLETVDNGSVWRRLEKGNNDAFRFSGRSTILSSAESDLLHITLLSLLTDTSTRSYQWFFPLTIIGALLLSLVLACTISFLVASKLFKPIDSILHAIENPEQLTQSTENAHASAELQFISQNISKSFQTTKEMEKKLAQRLLLLKNAQSLALYSQITPHFLFNTLQTINLIALESFHGDNPISETISLLADMLRISLKEGENIIPLATELRHAKSYEKIQQLRQPDLFQIRWDVEDGLEDALVPKVILQPLLENALSHGIKCKGTFGTIDVSIHQTADGIRIVVSDDGVGLSREKLQQLNEDLQFRYTAPVDHIGLQNVNQRIKLTYGETYGISASQSEAGGLCITILIPNITTMQP